MTNARDVAAETFDLAREIVREAGALALGYFKDTGSLTITDKGVNGMISNADLETERPVALPSTGQVQYYRPDYFGLREPS